MCIRDRVVGRGIVAEETDVHLARAGMQRGARGQDRSTAHAGVAADDRHAAEAALVRGGAARGPARREQGRRVERGGRPGRRRVERVDRDLAGMVAAVAEIQAGFGRDEAQCVRGRDGGAVADARAAVGIDAARHVEREHASQATRARRQQLGERREGARHGPRQADPEQAVDAPAIGVERGGRLGRDRHAGLARERQRPARVLGFRLDRQTDLDLHAEPQQLDGRDQRVAAVVAGARREPDRARLAFAALGQPARGGGAGTRHQRMRRQRGGGLGFGRAQVGDAGQRQGQVGERGVEWIGGPGVRRGRGGGQRGGRGERRHVERAAGAAGRDAARGRRQVAKRSTWSAASVSAGT
ncbi:hypothetical protein DRA46_01434 [Burkholderia gladioli]|nr:hypothetical protein [Burkholderia gladioli]